MSVSDSIKEGVQLICLLVCLSEMFSLRQRHLRCHKFEGSLSYLLSFCLIKATDLVLKKNGFQQ